MSRGRSRRIDSPTQVRVTARFRATVSRTGIFWVVRILSRRGPPRRAAMPRTPAPPKRGYRVALSEVLDLPNKTNLGPDDDDGRLTSRGSLTSRTIPPWRNQRRAERTGKAAPKEDESDCGTNPGSRAKRSRWGFAQNEGNPRARMNLRCRAEQPRDVLRMNPALMFSRLCSVPSVGCRCEAAAGRRRLEPSAKLRMNPALVFSWLCSVSSVDARHPPVDVVSSPCQNCG